MSAPHPLDALIDALHQLPGVGEKSAARMAFHLLQHDRAAAATLAAALRQALEVVTHCRQCHTLSDSPLCSVCADESRDATRLCVVETPADQLAMERTGAFRGYYFVLMGNLNPLSSVRPADIGVQKLLERAADGTVQEVIIATNFTAPGEVTAHVLAQSLKKRGLKVTRLAKGVPAGSELEYVDLATIAHAYEGRG